MTALTATSVQPRWRLLARRRPTRTSRSAAVDYVFIGILLAVTLIGLLAPLLVPYDPVQPTGTPKLTPLSPGHLLGTDSIGRDVASRVLLGLRTSWLMSIVVTGTGLVIGTIIGLIAGMFGGWVDTVLMRFTEVFLALPSMLVAVAVAAALGPGLVNTFIAVSIVWWPYYARIIRGETRALATRPHVEAARLAGVGWFRIMWRHLLPGTVPTAIISASLDIGNVVLVLSSLSFLGLGQPAPAPELGSDTSSSLTEILNAWWIPLTYGMVVMLLSLISNLAGDAIRNRFAASR
ncbi:ABC transporter permease [Brooklawnia cerclae]|uniref:Peptide/nickel transport system permease protein n=1 Tax=Brooklawnia cerclae TaxID=349934 RepID=A0ABX0SB87_9ACTN|nr:ABC transporter permease [Brooklawnia cerclae]NIH55667.1 peptide/nickel transport system permease protein [Brooklawnia cerclae]